jgi:DNA-binding MarR family transcriptional regulator
MSSLASREDSRGSGPLALEILKKFRIIVVAVRQHSRELEVACGIGGAQVWMLSAIAQTPDLTVSRLSQALAIHVSTASNMLEKLARKGLVERLRNDDDRRTVRLRISAAGQAILDRAPLPLSGPMIDALGKMQAESLSALDENLSELIRHINTSDPAAAHEPL